jgi:O-antigen ligase
LVRARYLSHLDPTQVDYATSKVLYFVLIVLPIAVAVALMIDRPESLWPTALMWMAIGLVVGVTTVALLGERFFGEDRYTLQGNLIALSGVLVVQPWLIRKFWVSAGLGVLAVAGIWFAAARQSLAAFGLALALSAVYWGIARFMRLSGTTKQRVWKAATGPYVILPIVLIVLAGASIAFSFNPNRLCHCISDRIISLQQNPGDRDHLVVEGVKLFAANPVLGGGLGAFAGRVADYLHPGTFYQYPHNVPLEILAETGIVGFTLLLVPLLVSWAVLLWRGMKESSPAIGAVIMIVAVFFVIANVSGDIPSERGMWVFGIAALKLALTREPRLGQVQ